MPIINLDPIKLHMHDILTNPTGKGSSFVGNRLRIKEDLEKRYRVLLFKHKNFKYKIYKSGESYFFHFKIPSETYDNLFYDVILEFYPDEKEVINDRNLHRYYVKMFSNSPAFMFTYTYVAYHNKMIPQKLKKFCSKTALKQRPVVRNPVETYGYEKSVYFACLYIAQFKLFNKFEIEKTLYRFKDDKTFEETLKTQEEKLIEYNKIKKEITDKKKKEKAEKIKKVQKAIDKNNKKNKKSVSSKKKKTTKKKK